jgi:hypothetical protein
MFYGNYIIVTSFQSNAMAIIDIKNPASPVITVHSGMGGRVGNNMDAFMQDNYFITGSGASIHFTKITDSLTLPTRSSKAIAYVSVNIKSITSYGNHIFALSFDGTLHTVDLAQLDTFSIHANNMVVGDVNISHKLEVQDDTKFNANVLVDGEVDSISLVLRKKCIMPNIPTSDQGLVNFKGSMYFDTTTNKMVFYNGTAWETITSA